jgi:hypothetical protein
MAKASNNCLSTYFHVLGLPLENINLNELDRNERGGFKVPLFSASGACSKYTIVLGLLEGQQDKPRTALPLKNGLLRKC